MTGRNDSVQIFCILVKRFSNWAEVGQRKCQHCSIWKKYHQQLGKRAGSPCAVKQGFQALSSASISSFEFSVLTTAAPLKGVKLTLCFRDVQQPGHPETEILTHSALHILSEPLLQTQAKSWSRILRGHEQVLVHPEVQHQHGENHELLELASQAQKHKALFQGVLKSHHIDSPGQVQQQLSLTV